MASMLLAVWLLSAAGPGPAPAPTPAPSSSPFALAEVAPGVFAAIASPGDTSSRGNAGFVIGSESVLVVDAFMTPEAARALIAQIRTRTPLPIRFLVETHFHPDHVSGNAVFEDAGAVVLAHETGRARTAAPARPPAVTYSEGVTLWLGDRRVDVFHREGHSGGDSLVRVADAGVVFTGDLVSPGRLPNLRDGSLDAWIATLDGLLREYPDARFVPGHGAPGRALDVRKFRDYLSSLRMEVSRAMRAGKSGDALAADVRARLASRYGHWDSFDRVDANIADAVRALRGTTASPPAPTP